MSSLDFDNMYERHDNPEEELEQQQQQQRIVFRTLDPILRLLLASMEQEKQIMTMQRITERNSEDDTIDNNTMQRRLSWVQSQTKLLQQLGQTIRNMTNNPNTTATATGTGNHTAHMTTGLLLMAEYIFLPLHLVMQPQQEQESHPNDYWHDTQNSPRQEVSEL
eukprot:scaffold75701_cov44-Attheya_sp.AAC.1